MRCRTVDISSRSAAEGGVKGVKGGVKVDEIVIELGLQTRIGVAQPVFSAPAGKRRSRGKATARVCVTAASFMRVLEFLGLVVPGLSRDP